MTDHLQLAVAGATGAFGQQHLKTLAALAAASHPVTVRWQIGAPGDEPRVSDDRVRTGIDLAEALADPAVDGVILATPTPLHASQAIACLQAGKHVLVEIPMADTLRDARALVAAQQDSGLVAMAGHTRRFNPGHQWMHRQLQKGDLVLQHLEVQTRFMRRSNTNALGQPRDWADHLLWHHACHTVDLFQYQTGQEPERLQALQGPVHPQLGIVMDMAVALRSPAGALCSLALSFNNDGPFGTDFRYICDRGTYIARYDGLTDGQGEAVDLTAVAGPEPAGMPQIGLARELLEFMAAIREQRPPQSSVAACLPAMQTLHELASHLAGE